MTPDMATLHPHHSFSPSPSLKESHLPLSVVLCSPTITMARQSRCRELGLRIVAPFLYCLSVFIFFFASFASLRLDSGYILLQPAELGLLFSSPKCTFNRVTRNDSWRLTDDKEEELMRQAVAASCPAVESVEGGKVAFMFLTRGGMPLRLLWERFFYGQDRELFSIYHHASPEYKEDLPQNSVFAGCRIPSKSVQWGSSSMIDAERRLLANALLDPSNRWFVLLSESCIPLFNFTYIRDYLTGSRLSFLGSFDDPKKPGRGRYDRRMHPDVTLRDWRKGSQWFAMHRTLAVTVVSDRTYYPLFREYCRPRCYMDEHYLPTLVTKSRRLSGSNSNRSLTWVDWSRGGPHPTTYRRKDVTVALLERMSHGSGSCSGSATEVCFLFARKFDGSTLGPLRELAQVLYG